MHNQTLINKTTVVMDEYGTKFHAYLMEDGAFPWKEHYYYWISIKTNRISVEEQKQMLEVLDPLFSMYGTLLFEDEIWIIHLEDTIAIKDLLVSMSDDFGFSIKAYVSSPIDASHRHHFWFIEEAYRLYLQDKPFTYAGTTELIHEVMKQEYSKLRFLREPILNRIIEDSQLVKLIYSFFDHQLNITKTAKHVYMHRNTIMNKLDFIYQESGLKIQQFHDAVAMYALLRSK